MTNPHLKALLESIFADPVVALAYRTAPAAMVTNRVERGRSELEDLVEQAVERTLVRLSIPTRRDVEALSARVDELEARLARASGTPASRTRSTTRRSGG